MPRFIYWTEAEAIQADDDGNPKVYNVGGFVPTYPRTQRYLDAERVVEASRHSTGATKPADLGAHLAWSDSEIEFIFSDRTRKRFHSKLGRDLYYAIRGGSEGGGVPANPDYIGLYTPEGHQLIGLPEE